MSKKRDQDRADVVNYIIEKVSGDVENGVSAPYVADMLYDKIDVINAMYSSARKYGVASFVSAITSVVSIPATMFLTNNYDDFEKGMGIVLLTAGISGLFQVMRRWAKKDARILESKLIKMFVDKREYVNANEMPDEIYKKYYDSTIYEPRENERF